MTVTHTHTPSLSVLHDQTLLCPCSAPPHVVFFTSPFLHNLSHLLLHSHSTLFFLSLFSLHFNYFPLLALPLFNLLLMSPPALLHFLLCSCFFPYPVPHPLFLIQSHLFSFFSIPSVAFSSAAPSVLYPPPPTSPPRCFLLLRYLRISPSC